MEHAALGSELGAAWAAALASGPGKHRRRQRPKAPAVAPVAAPLAKVEARPVPKRPRPTKPDLLSAPPALPMPVDQVCAPSKYEPPPIATVGFDWTARTDQRWDVTRQWGNRDEIGELLQRTGEGAPAKAKGKGKGKHGGAPAVAKAKGKGKHVGAPAVAKGKGKANQKENKVSRREIRKCSKLFYLEGRTSGII